MRLIDKRAAYEALKKEAEMHEMPFTREAYERAARIIDKMYAFTIEVNARHGHWHEFHARRDDNGYIICDYECTVCGGILRGLSGCDELNMCNYCPHCGARMDGDEDAAD
jgi:hypothetical protein